MAFDTIYALREAFELITQAELQFLSLCDARLSKFEDTCSVQDLECLFSLKNLKKLLDRHLLQNEESSGFLKKTRHSH